MKRKSELISFDQKISERSDEIFRQKWRKLCEAGSLITNTTADQIRREAIKETEKESRFSTWNTDRTQV